MKKFKLNNKGMTAVEILICFVIVVIISVSLYTTVSTYKNKQQIEAFKEKIMTYKNLLTKEINDDLIKDGLVAANITEFSEDPVAGDTYSVEMSLRNGEKKCLKITSIKAYDYLWESSMESKFPASQDKDDYFMIAYGDCGNETEYPIPDLGESKNPNNKIIKDFRINNVSVSTDNSVLSIYVGFYHPDLGTRYALDIICPINF